MAQQLEALFLISHHRLNRICLIWLLEYKNCDMSYTLVLIFYTYHTWITGSLKDKTISWNYKILLANYSEIIPT